MANRIVFVIATVVVISVCCSASTLRHKQLKEDIKEAKERHWNRTVADLAVAKSELASRVEAILSKTAAKLIESGKKMSEFKQDIKTKMAVKLAQESAKLDQLKNKAAAKMVETKVKMDEAKDAVAAAVGAGVAKVVEKVQVLVGLKKAAVAKVIGKVNDVNAKIQQHKAEKKQELAAKIAFVPLPAKAAKPVQVVSKTTDSPTKSI